jgi:hypothetical protein
MRAARAATGIGFGSALFLGVVLAGAAANASPITCTSTIVLPGGDGFVQDTSLKAGVCVQTLDAVFGNFAISSLPQSGNVAFNVTNSGVPNVAHHGVSFNDNFSEPGTYTADYSVDILTGSNLFKELDADFSQSNGGPSTLTTTTTEAGSGSILITKNGSTGTGTDQILYAPGFARLDVTNKLVDDGSDSSILNTAVENAPVGIAVPEPATIALFGTALIGLLAIRHRRQLAPPA